MPHQNHWDIAVVVVVSVPLLSPANQHHNVASGYWPSDRHFLSVSIILLLNHPESSPHQPHQLDHLLISHIKLIISHINFLSAKINLITPWPFKALKLFHAAQAVFDWIQPCNLRLPVKAQVKYMASPSNIWKNSPKTIIIKQSSNGDRSSLWNLKAVPNTSKHQLT